MTFWPFTVTLTLNAVIYFFHKTLAYDDIPTDQVWLPKNQQFFRYSTKSYFDQMSEDSKQLFAHDTLAHDAASSYQVW